jgi:stalled ribosome rescue protein Dom34
MSHYHAVVWLDHSQARVFQFNPRDVQSKVVHAQGGHGHVHHKAGVIGAGHGHGDSAYFKSVADALNGVNEVLVMGPGAAKQEFVKHLGQHAKAVSQKVVAVETVDHLTDHQIVARAREHFAQIDRTLPQKG